MEGNLRRRMEERAKERDKEENEKDEWIREMKERNRIREEKK